MELRKLAVCHYPDGKIIIYHGQDGIYLTLQEAQSLYQTLATILGIETITVFPTADAMLAARREEG